MGRERWVAWIAEEVDDDEKGPIALGLFSGHLEAFGPDEPEDALDDEWWPPYDGFSRLPPDPAVAWGCQRAARVIVRVCDSWENTHYSAGEVHLTWHGKPLPQWDEADVSLGRRRLPEWEFVDRTEDDEAISWDVLIGATQVDGRAVPAFAGHWRRALATNESVEIIGFEEDPTYEEVASWPDQMRQSGLSFITTWGASPARAVMRLPGRTVDEARQRAIEAAENAANVAMTELGVGMTGRGVWDWHAEAFPSDSRWAVKGLL